MAFQKLKKQPQFADLKIILAQTKDTENPLYQTVQVLIDRLSQFQELTLKDIADINASINTTDTIINISGADKNASYLTAIDESLNLPNSRELIAGIGITLDVTIPNQMTISADATANYYDSPLTDGDIDETDLIFALGDCVIVQVPI